MVMIFLLLPTKTSNHCNFFEPKKTKQTNKNKPPRCWAAIWGVHSLSLSPVLCLRKQYGIFASCVPILQNYTLFFHSMANVQLSMCHILGLLDCFQSSEQVLVIKGNLPTHMTIGIMAAVQFAKMVRYSFKWYKPSQLNIKWGWLNEVLQDSLHKGSVSTWIMSKTLLQRSSRTVEMVQTDSVTSNHKPLLLTVFLPHFNFTLLDFFFPHIFWWAIPQQLLHVAANSFYKHDEDKE